MFNKSHRLSFFKSWSKKDDTRLPPNPLTDTDGQSSQPLTAQMDSNPVIDPNIAPDSISKGNGPEQKSSLTSQLLSASATNTNRSRIKMLSEEYPNDDQPLEEYDSSQWGVKVIKIQPPEKADAVDIIAIHGMGGHWEAAWTDLKTRVNWLKSLLGEDIPNARIMSYSYNAKEHFGTPDTGIRDFASGLLVDYKYYRTSASEKSRPIIFLCHSLGGIVFKQALVRANEEPEYLNILGHVHGVIFFSTPHQVSTPAKWSTIATNILIAASIEKSTNIMFKDLKLRSNLLSSIAESWVHQGANLEIVSCYETMRTCGMSIVPQDSALLQWPNETPISMNADHSTVCKFSSRSDPNYQKVISKLKEMSNKGIEKFKNNERVLSEVEEKLLTSLETSDYESHLTEIVQCAKGTCSWVLQTQRYREFDESTTGKLLWISADAGCGKSVLAKYLIHYHKKRRLGTNVCFFIFKNGNLEQENCVYALSALLHQICSFQPDLLEHAILKRKYFTGGNNLKMAFEALWEVFEDTIHDKRLKDTLCIIDALDECEKSTRLLLVERLAQLFSTDQRKPFSLKIIITSRPDNAIKIAFRTIPNIWLQGENEIMALNHDIRLFMQTSVNQTAVRSDLPPDLLANLQKALIDGIDFPFLWTSLVIDLLKKASLGGMPWTDLEAILRTRNLDDIYEYLLSRRPSVLKAKKMLYIVIAAARPLSLEELSIAVEVHQDYKRLLRKELPPGKEFDARRIADLRKMEDSDPSQSYHKAASLEGLKRHLKHPFSNHIRRICGHFLRIRGGKIYLIHQTARQFLLKETSKEDFSVGHYLREFKWNISCPTAKEMRHIEQHGIPGIFESRKEDADSQPLQVWRHSLRYDIANRYLLQVCVDYFEVLENMWVAHQRLRKSSVSGLINHRVSEPSSSMREDCLEWWLEIKEYPCSAFLDYATRYWVMHYRDVRVEVDGYFDYLCIPGNLLFELWTLQHPSFINNIQYGMSKSCHSPEVPLQTVLDHFDLDREVSELWDQEYIEGPHYWKHNESSLVIEEEEEGSGDGESGIYSRSIHTPKLFKVPDRIRAFRNQHRERIARSGGLELSCSPGRTGTSFLSSGRSLRFSSMTRQNWPIMEEASPAVSVQRGFKPVMHESSHITSENSQLEEKPAVFN